MSAQTWNLQHEVLEGRTLDQSQEHDPKFLYSFQQTQQIYITHVAHCKKKKESRLDQHLVDPNFSENINKSDEKS